MSITTPGNDDNYIDYVVEPEEKERFALGLRAAVDTTLEIARDSYKQAFGIEAPNDKAIFADAKTMYGINFRWFDINDQTIEELLNANGGVLREAIRKMGEARSEMEEGSYPEHEMDSAITSFETYGRAGIDDLLRLLEKAGREFGVTDLGIEKLVKNANKEPELDPETVARREGYQEEVDDIMQEVG